MKKALLIFLCAALFLTFGLLLYSFFSDRTITGTVVEVSKGSTLIVRSVTLISVGDDRGKIHTVGFYDHVDYLSVGDKVEITYSHSDRVAMRTVRRETESSSGVKRIEIEEVNFWTIRRYKILSRR